MISSWPRRSIPCDQTEAAPFWIDERVDAQRRGEIERRDEKRIEPDADDVENDRAQHHVDDAKDFDEQIGRSEFAVRKRFIPSLPRHGKSVQLAEQKERERDERHGDDRDDYDVAAAPITRPQPASGGSAGGEFSGESCATPVNRAPGRARFPCATRRVTLDHPPRARPPVSRSVRSRRTSRPPPRRGRSPCSRSGRKPARARGWRIQTSRTSATFRRW